jgi:hypothetical protein
MNANSTDTRNPHLDLGDLIAGAAGQPIGDRAMEHMSGCEHCQLESKRWNLVADGVRGLAAAAPAAQPALSPRTRRRVQPPRRRVMLVATGAAAALVLLIGIGAVTGLMHVRLSSPSSEPALTAVTGCTQLEQAVGTLEQVNGRNLVIQMPGARSVTVTTTASTFVSMSGAPLSDITDGASVIVRGYMSDGTIQAAIVTVGQPFSAVNPPGFVPVQGTVTDAGTTAFTLVTSAGTRVPVTASGNTLVIVPHASLRQLRDGARIFALGNLGPDGTLSARAVATVSQLRSGLHINVRVRNCSPSSIVEALGAISSAHPSAG